MPPHADEPPPPGVCVLVVDDEPLICTLVASFLRGEGFHVLQALNGEEATRLVASAPVRLALIDMRLRGLEGTTLATRLRALSPNLPVVLMSGDDIGKLRLQVPGVNVAGYLQKPFTIRDLLGEVRRALRPTEEGPPAG